MDRIKGCYGRGLIVRKENSSGTNLCKEFCRMTVYIRFTEVLLKHTHPRRCLFVNGSVSSLIGKWESLFWPTPRSRVCRAVPA